jgi:hypothetical protein
MMDALIFLGTVAIFDLFVAMLIRRDIMTLWPIDRSTTY